MERYTFGKAIVLEPTHTSDRARRASAEEEMLDLMRALREADPDMGEFFVERRDMDSNAVLVHPLSPTWAKIREITSFCTTAILAQVRYRRAWAL